MKEAVIVLSDTHVNSKLGLCPPEILDDDGDIHKYNLIQEWLWENWHQFIKDVKKIVGKTYVNLILNGDIVDLDSKHRTDQMISRNPVTIMRMADKVFKPILEIADKLFVIRGTEVHTGNSGWLEEMFAEKYGAVKDEMLGQHSWRHLRAEFSSVKFDIAHHNSMGMLPWTYANSMSRLISVTALEYLKWNEIPPNVVVRAHRHQHVDTGTTFSTRGVSLPCWQYLTGYLYRLGKENAYPDIGGVAFLCDSGEHTYKPLLYKPKRSPVWTNKSIVNR